MKQLKHKNGCLKFWQPDGLDQGQFGEAKKAGSGLRLAVAQDWYNDITSWKTCDTIWSTLVSLFCRSRNFTSCQKHVIFECKANKNTQIYQIRF